MFDVLPDAVEVTRELTSINYSAPSTIEQAVQFHSEQLTAAGWTFKKETLSNERARYSDFSKDGFRLQFGVSNTNEKGQVSVSFSNLCPINVAALPHPAKAILDSDHGVAASFIVTEKSNTRPTCSIAACLSLARPRK